MRFFRMVVGLAWAASASAGAIGQATAPAPAAPRLEPIPRAIFISTMDAEFKKTDADQSGTLTRREIEDFERAAAANAARQRNVALFQALDRDRNGQLSSAEFGGLPMNMPQPNAAAALAQVDGNRDGKATLVEYRVGKLVNFDRMDEDKDGVVSLAEMRAAGLIK